MFLIMSCEQHHECDGLECQGNDACGVCGVWAPCDCPSDGVPVLVEGDETTPVPDESMATLVFGGGA